MSAANTLDRLSQARRALVVASDAVGLPLPAAPQAQLRPGRGPVSTGFEGLDAALGGGVPRGRLVEIVGARSSGRLSLALSVLARAVAGGECAAFVDPADALDPRALPAEVRSRVLWVRPDDAPTALRCADLLLDGGGFAVVALYLVRLEHRVGAGVWARLVRRAERARACVLVVTDPRHTDAPGAFAHVTLATERGRALFHGQHALAGVCCTVAVTRNRTGGSPTGPLPLTFRAG